MIKPLLQYILLFTSFIMLSQTAARAQENDLNGWGVITSSIETGEKTFIWLEAQPRFTNDISRLGQLLLRTGVGYKVDKKTSVVLGYAYIFTDPVGPSSSNEHRIWQQLSFNVFGDGNGVTLKGRSRLEQRIFEGSGDVGVRFRQQLNLSVPLNEKLKAVFYTEPFITLNTTSIGQRDGLNVWRNFAGLSFPISKNVSLSPGYLNQYVPRVGEDRIDHVAVVGISTKF